MGFKSWLNPFLLSSDIDILQSDQNQDELRMLSYENWASLTIQDYLWYHQL